MRPAAAATGRRAWTALGTLGALATLAALAPGADARAQGGNGTGQINGQVFDKSRKGVPGLTVAAIAEELPLIYGTSTEQDGRYAFRGMAAGTYSVVVAPAGRAPLRKDGIRVRPLFRSIVDFTIGGDAPAESLPPVRPAPASGAAPSAGAGGASEEASGEAGGTPTGGPGTDGDGLVVACSVAGPGREPVPGIAVTMTPVEGSGRLRRARTAADGSCVLREIEPGRYRLAVRAPGFMTWGLGPLALDGPGRLTLSLTLVTFPLNFKGTVEDALVPADPIPPPR